MPDSRKDDFVRGGNGIDFTGHHNRRAQMVERFLHRIQIAGAVIQDRNHKSPLVLGSIRARRWSREQATRNARAKALNSASIL